MGCQRGEAAILPTYGEPPSRRRVRGSSADLVRHSALLSARYDAGSSEAAVNCDDLASDVACLAVIQQEADH